MPTRNKFYSGLKDIQFDQTEKIGFFTTYISTSWDIHIAERFALESWKIKVCSCICPTHLDRSIS